jgi:hypothetical protein
VASAVIGGIDPRLHVRGRAAQNRSTAAEHGWAVRNRGLLNAAWGIGWALLLKLFAWMRGKT